MISPYIFAGLRENKIPNLKINLPNHEVLKIICKEFEMDYQRVMDSKFEKTRKREVLTIRQVFFFVKRELTKDSLASIGSVFNQEHGTVLNGIKTIKSLIETEKEIKNKVNFILNEIKMKKIAKNNIEAEQIIKKYDTKKIG